jgi:hypothetical protein
LPLGLNVVKEKEYCADNGEDSVSSAHKIDLITSRGAHAHGCT